MAHLGHRVMSPAVRAEPVGAREEIRLEDRLQHQLQGCLDHPVARSVAIPRRRSLPPGLGIIRSRTGSGRKLRSFSCARSSSRNSSTPAHSLDGAGGAPVHPGRARPLVAPHPIPRHQQERGIGDEVEQIIEPAMRIITGPTVQLGLDLQYPALRPIQDGLRLVGIHRRQPPGLPVTSAADLLAPFAMCAALPRARTTTGPPPRPRPSADNATCPPPDWLPGGEGDRGTVPTFTPESIDQGGAQLYPDSIATATPQAFTVASPPDTQNRLRSWPPPDGRTATRCNPAHIRQV